MIVVLNTNVYISAVISNKGNPAIILRAWEKGEFEVALSNDLFNEIKTALNYPQIQHYYFSPEKEVRIFLSKLKKEAFFVKPRLKLDVVERDPDDNRVLECAEEANADFIVSGDKHLLELKQYQDTTIINPAGFVQYLRLQNGDDELTTIN
jgi:putative PIN family toxin of toxin-antitoxin system